MAGRRPTLLRAAGALAVAAVLLAAAPVAAQEPGTQLKASVDRILRILEDPALKSPTKTAERREALRKVVGDIYDFDEMSRRTLGPHWRTLTDDQRKEFVQLFTELIETSYITKIELYNGEPIRYTGNRVDGDIATIATRLVTKNGTEIPIDYRMLKRPERWVVYDVSVEGVSLVNNYRTQFNSVMRSSSYAELARKMRERIDQLRRQS